MRKSTVKRVSAFALAMMLAIPAVTTAPKADAAKKAPCLDSEDISILPDSTYQIKVQKNGTKIKKTTWSTSDADVVTLTAKKKTAATIKAGGAGDTKATITAKVKYKTGKKTKTKKLSCKVAVDWLAADVIGAHTNASDGNTNIAVYFNLLAENINPYDVVPNDTTKIEGEWTTNASNVVEVTEGASGSAVALKRVAYSDERGPRLLIDLGKPVTEKTAYHVVLKGFKGSGSKMMIEGDVTVDPIQVSISQVDYFNPELKGDIAITLKANINFNVYAPDYDKKANEKNRYIVVKDENGKELPIEVIVPTTVKEEGDELVVDVKGGADSKKFTVEVTNAFAANYFDPTKVYDITTKTIVVDKLRHVTY